ncbi:DNA-directed RNA polymerase subunit alpha [Striga asiatica]|uniref:DNA-directed RNA polymerase subunit alpha n=1 Tax=Striga asiatica TaxID=4170 RepID=A0A5A7Q9A2_STRAF|nr:DNA-directed RNA polymerase subunit alpha [Striga asiatica]
MPIADCSTSQRPTSRRCSEKDPLKDNKTPIISRPLHPNFGWSFRSSLVKTLACWVMSGLRWVEVVQKRGGGGGGGGAAAHRTRRSRSNPRMVPPLLLAAAG